MRSGDANNIFGRRDWLVGIPLLFCALTLPFAEGLPFRNEVTCILIGFYGFFLTLTIFYRPSARYIMLLFAYWLGVPDAFQVSMPQNGADWILRGWRWCWIVLAGAAWLRCYLERREKGSALSGAAEPTVSGRSGTAPRLSRPIRIMTQVAGVGVVGLVALMGLQRAYQNAALIYAIDNDDAATAHKWLNRGANPNCIGENRADDDDLYIWEVPTVSALNLASQKHEAEIAADLLAHGANENEYPHGGSTPLIAAVSDDTLPVMRVLLAHDADVNTREPRTAPDAAGDRTALFFTRSVKTTRALLEHNADVHVRSSDGSTVLHSRLDADIMPEDVEIFSTFLEAGADPLVKNNNGKTAREIAEERIRDTADTGAISKYKQIVVMLKRAEAARK